jgi:hypothetical protein
MEAGVQISDIVVGLLAKMHTCLTRTSLEEVLVFRRGASGTSLDNLKLLRDCISKSDAENPAFLHHVAALADREKVDALLQFSDGLYGFEGSE